MIVPSQRLLVVVACVTLPTALAWSADAGLARWGAVAVMLAVVVAVADAILGRRSPRGLSAQLPPVIRWSQGRRGEIEVQLTQEHPRARNLRLALALPPALESPSDEQTVALPSTSPSSVVRWSCTPRQRGLHRIQFLCLEVRSPLGLWEVRARLPVACEVRVYPNLVSERSRLAALFLNRGNYGMHALRQVGKGREFEKLRDYMPGDSYDEIHWKATAKHGKPVTKVYQIERTQEVYVVIDSSRLSARRRTAAVDLAGRHRCAVAAGVDPGEEETAAEQPDEAAALHPAVSTTLDRFLTSALVLAQAAEQQGDLYGLVTFSDRVDAFVRAGNGREHYGHCRDALFTLTPRLVTPDYAELATFLRLRLRRRALLVFLTELDDPVLAEGFVRGVEMICRQHVILVSMVQPRGVRPLFEEDQVTSLNDVYAELAGHLRWHTLRELERTLRRRGVHFGLVPHERLAAELVTQYLNVKRRQLL